MKFLVNRTSIWDDDEKPCENAEQESFTRIEIRTLHSFEEFNLRFGKSEGFWLSKGINHCINKDGYIQREIPNGTTGWFIEINSLEELIKFKEKYGDIIIKDCYHNENIPALEIYDDYRE